MIVLNKLSFERALYNELKNKYEEIRDKNDLFSELKMKLFKLKLAEKEQKFHFEKTKGIVDNIEKVKSTVLWQEKLILNLEKEIEISLKKNNFSGFLKRL